MVRALCLLPLALVACSDPVFSGDCDGGACVDAGAGGDAGSAEDAAAPDGGPDAPDGSVEDAGAPDGGVDAGALDEVEETPDFADCVAEGACPHDAPKGRIDLAAIGSCATLRGRIDDAPHARPTACGEQPLGDLDLVEIRAPARSLVRLELAPQLPAEETRFHPYMLTSTGTAILTYSAVDEPIVTESSFVFPWSLDYPMFVSIEHVANALQTPCDGSVARVGGEGYGWELRACAVDPEVVELGELGASSGAELSRAGDALRVSGDMRLYRATQAAGGGAVRATATKAFDCDECTPWVVFLDPAGGGARYVDPATSLDEPGVETYAPFEEAEEILFVVADESSRGGMGYRYDVTLARE